MADRRPGRLTGKRPADQTGYTSLFQSALWNCSSVLIYSKAKPNQYAKLSTTDESYGEKNLIAIFLTDIAIFILSQASAEYSLCNRF